MADGHQLCVGCHECKGRGRRRYHLHDHSKGIVPAIFRNVITTITAAAKISLNFTELVHLTLIGDEAGDIRCLLLLRGAIPSWTLALIYFSPPVSTTTAFRLMFSTKFKDIVRRQLQRHQDGFYWGR